MKRQKVAISLLDQQARQQGSNSSDALEAGEPLLLDEDTGVAEAAARAAGAPRPCMSRFELGAEAAGLPEGFRKPLSMCDQLRFVQLRSFLPGGKYRPKL